MVSFVKWACLVSSCKFKWEHVNEKWHLTFFVRFLSHKWSSESRNHYLPFIGRKLGSREVKLQAKYCQVILNLSLHCPVKWIRVSASGTWFQWSLSSCWSRRDGGSEKSPSPVLTTNYAFPFTDFSSFDLQLSLWERILSRFLFCFWYCNLNLGPSHWATYIPISLFFPPWDRVSLCYPGWPRPHGNPPSSASEGWHYRREPPHPDPSLSFLMRKGLTELLKLPRLSSNLWPPPSASQSAGLIGVYCYTWLHCPFL